MAFVIKQELCSGCHQCRTECPAGAITFRNVKYWIDPEKCISCGRCVKVCHNGCISDPENPPAPVPKHEKLEMSCDVCVVGAGGSGMVAAAKAADEGLSVILLEKNHEVGGSAWYAGGYRAHWSKLHAAAGAEDPRPAEYERFIQKVEGNVDKALLKRMFEANEQFVDWMVEEHRYLDDYDFAMSPRGGRFVPKYTWERASKRIDKMIGPGEAGWYITTRLRDDLIAKGGRILYKTSGRKLLMEDGACVGILAEDAGGEIEIHAKSVVLATGAFTRNKELMAKFQPLFYDDEGKQPVHIFTGSGCTGDGITMCIDIGADIDYENRRVNLFGPMRHPYPCVSLNICMSGSGVTLGSQGNLFKMGGMTEVSPLAYDPKRYCWTIVDDRIAEAAIDRAMKEPPQSPGMDLPAFLKNWRAVLQEEENAGAIVSASTLEELCSKLGFDQAAFGKIIEDYNESTKHPVPPPPDMDPMFRRPDPMPITQGPFYAMKLGLFHEDAVGGMTIDKNASVLKNGVPVPGLYAAGDTTRGIMVPGEIGVNYIEGVFSCLTQAFNEGYIAGVEASRHAKV